VSRKVNAGALIAATCFFLALKADATAKSASVFSYPTTRKDAQADDYNGVKVADPYRWLEDDKSPEVADWVKEENKVTFSYLSQIPYRQQIRDRLAQLTNYPKYSAPQRRGEMYFFSKNEGLQNQDLLYAQKSLEGKPELLLDPNQFLKRRYQQAGRHRDFA
jgi:prolyl oligopeptidase